MVPLFFCLEDACCVQHFSSFKNKLFFVSFLPFFLLLLVPVIKVLALNFGSHSEVLEVYHNVLEPSL